MITEPASSAAQSAIAGISSTILAWTGITFHALLWSFFGVLAALVFIAPAASNNKSFSLRVFGGVFIATIVGAGIAEVLHAMLTMTSLPEKTVSGAHLGMALIAGAGAKPLLIAGINRMVRVFGGEK